MAVKRENVVSVRHLLESGAASSLRDCDGESPLHYAIFGHRDDLVSILIGHGADPGVVNQSGPGLENRDKFQTRIGYMLQNFAFSRLHATSVGYNVDYICSLYFKSTFSNPDQD